jgi:4-diphosphocytidyl-2-C-methyl-D-erythritol kinase
MISFPNAKINIGLNVVEKREDGYHNLETILFPVNLCDALEVVESKTYNICFTGLKIDSPPGANLVEKAYNVLKEVFDLPPVSIHLHKVIPFGAGLGGGSSDGAFMLKMLNNLFELKMNSNSLEKYALGLGADCPFFIKNQTVFATGVGEKLKLVKLNLSEYSFVIIKPSFSIATSEAFRDITPKLPNRQILDIVCSPVNEWKDNLNNDFEASISSIYSEISDIKEKLYRLGASYASMSGSGSAVYGIFQHSPINLDKYFPNNYFIYR